MGIDFGNVKIDIRKMLVELFTDAALNVSITYRLYASQSFDTAQGHNVNVYTNSTLNAIKLKHTDKSVQAIGDLINSTGSPTGKIQVGDVVYIIDFVGAPVGLTLKDLIDEGTETSIKIKQVSNVFDLVYFVTVEAK